MTVIIVGGGAAGGPVATELRAAGVTDVMSLDHEVVSSVFHDDAWTLLTSAGETFRARVVIAARPPFVPWKPELNGRNDFRGASFHAADWDPNFVPAGKRIAVVGTDSTAGYHLGRLTDSAVTVFAHAPRWVVTKYSSWVPLRTVPALRWLRRHTGLHRGPAVVDSAIKALTPSGIRTVDGVEHRVDAVIYGTGFQVSDQVSDEALVGAGGLTIRQAWSDGMEPYLGIAVHGFPNYFFVTGPDIAMQTRCIADCVRLIHNTDRTRIEVLRSSQQVFNERAHLAPAQVLGAVKAFELSSEADEDDETYDGTATLTIAGAPHPVRVRLRGHLDPIDGQYHWQGTVFSSIPDSALKQTRAATLTVGERSAPARIVERTPWGTHSIAGVGAPPYLMSRA